MIRSLVCDGPLATRLAFCAVCVVIVLATSSLRGSFAVIASLLMGVLLMMGSVAYFGERLNFLNFIALPITFGIGAGTRSTSTTNRGSSAGMSRGR